MNMRKALLALPLILGACATTPQNDVSATTAALKAAEELATIYIRLPPCPQPNNICSDIAIITKIKAADNAANDAVVAARNDPTNMALNNAAMAAVQSLIAATPKQGGK